MTGMGFIRIGKIDGAFRGHHLFSPVAKPQGTVLDDAHCKACMGMSGKPLPNKRGPHQLQIIDRWRAPDFHLFIPPRYHPTEHLLDPDHPIWQPRDKDTLKHENNQPRHGSILRRHSAHLHRTGYVQTATASDWAFKIPIWARHPQHATKTMARRLIARLTAFYCLLNNCLPPG